MQYLAGLLLAALMGLRAAPPDYPALVRAYLAPRLGPVGALNVTVQPPRDAARATTVGTITVAIDEVDLHRLPVEAILPLPAPRSPQARLEGMNVHITRGRLDRLKVSKLDVVSQGVLFDLPTALRESALRMTSAQRESVVVELRDGDLDALAASLAPGAQDAKVVFDQGRLVLAAQVPFLFSTLHLTISGRVAVEQGRLIVLHEAQIDSGRAKLSPEMRAALLARLNPLIDLDKTLGFPLPMRWNAVECGQGWCRLSGQPLDVELPTPPSEFDPRARYLR